MLPFNAQSGNIWEKLTECWKCETVRVEMPKAEDCLNLLQTLHFLRALQRSSLPFTPLFLWIDAVKVPENI